MKVKKYLVIAVAAACIIQAGTPVIIKAQNQEQAVDLEDTTNIEETQQKDSEKKEEKQVGSEQQNVRIFLAYQFSDGSLDVWQSGSGLIMDDKTIIIPASLGLATDDSTYENLAKGKKSVYSRVGVDLNNYETVKKSFVLYAVTSDGAYKECAYSYTDEAIGLTLLNSQESLNEGSAEFSDGYESSMTLTGFSSDELESTELSLLNGEASGTKAEGIKQDLSKESITDNVYHGTEMLDLGYVGGTIYESSGKICGMVLQVEEMEATVVSGNQIQNFVTYGPEEEEDNEKLTEALDKLELAVTRARNIDTSGYSEESVGTFQYAIVNAEQVLSDVNATYDDITNAGNALNEAKDGLKEVEQIKRSAPTKKQIMQYGGAAAFVVVLVGISALFATGKKSRAEQSEDKKRKVKEKKSKKKKRKTKQDKENEEVPVEGYGGELARQSVAGQDDDGEEGTSVLGNAGADETAVLKQELPEAYLEDEQGERIDISRKDFVIGKERKKVAFCITGNSTVSRRHCKIQYDGTDFYVMDLGSLNGTLVNGIRLEANVPTRLSDQDWIQISDVKFMIHINE